MRFRQETVIHILAFGLLIWAWVMIVGRDLSWDVVNHHVYLPFSLLSGRFQHDLMAAGTQSYQNPLGYVPFYLLMRAGLPAWGVGTVLAILHSLAVLPLVSIVRTLWGGGADHFWWRWLAIAMALASPVFLLTVGTSSIDPIGSLLVLAALATMVAPAPNLWLVLSSAAGLGLAIAIKPTAAIFALALGAVVLLRLLVRQLSWRPVLVFGITTSLTTALFWGPWAWWLWLHLHNPLFPLYNNVFQSPYFPIEPLVDRRFLPDSFAQWLLRPWHMAEVRRFASTEAFTPDLRPIALVMLSLVALPLMFWRRRAAPHDIEKMFATTAQLTIFVGVSFVLWMTISGNARYALPLLAVVGILLVRAIEYVLPPRQARGAALLLLWLSLLNYGMQGEHRLWPQPWSSGPYLDVRVPERLQQQPFLHLSIGLQSHAAFAASLNPDGELINAIGQLSIPSSGPLRAAFDERVRAWAGRVRFLFLANEHSDKPPPVLLKRRADRITYHLGLRVDWSDCESMRLLRGSDAEALWTLLSCRAVQRTEDDPDFFASRDRADRVFAAIEARCPRGYGPPPLVTDAGLDEWQRRYANTDIRVTIDANDAVIVSHHRSTAIVKLGTVDEVISGRGQEPCAAWKRLLNPS